MFDLAVSPIVLCGHVAIWTWIFNRLHAERIPRRWIKVLERGVMWTTVVIPPFAFMGLWFAGGWREVWQRGRWLDLTLLAYAVTCVAMMLFVSSAWVVRRWIRPPKTRLIANDSRLMDLSASFDALIGDRKTRRLAAIPGNQLLTIEINEKTVDVPDLDPILDGLSIAHFSDLHFTGKITRPFFERVVETVNAMDADLIAVTGDIADKAACIEWVPETLGKLQSRFGLFCILGNHDGRLDPPDTHRLRETIADSGLFDVGVQARQIEVRDRLLLLSGNEMPWFGPPPDHTPQPPGTAVDLRILLSHSPDQFGWARAQPFDLVLAGHTHGGQIRFPMIGATVCPSRYGTRYASGLFYESPTLMHVSRGVSGLHQLRFNCRPEVTKLILRRNGP